MGVEEPGVSESVLAKKSVDRLSEIIDNVGLPSRPSEIGILEKDLEGIAKSTVSPEPDLLKKNPRPVDEKDLLQILNNAY